MKMKMMMMLMRGVRAGHLKMIRIGSGASVKDHITTGEKDASPYQCCGS
jgi:hypothetical protein